MWHTLGHLYFETVNKWHRMNFRFRQASYNARIEEFDLTHARARIGLKKDGPLRMIKCFQGSSTIPINFPRSILF